MVIETPHKTGYPALLMHVAASLIFFSAALFPRLSLVVAGASYADDWGHLYSSHLDSYRPFAALELWTMQSLFGPDYLTFKLPKLLSAVWYALSLTVLMRMALQYGVPARLFLLLGTAALLHPMLNELVLWGVLSTGAFATFLCVVGVALVYLGTSPKTRVAGLFLLCLGASASQLLSTFGACIVVVEIAYRGFRAVLADGRNELGWRLAVVVLPPTVALAAILLMRFGLGYSDFASRSIGLSSPTMLGWLQDKFYVFSNAFANLYQAPFGVALGNPTALRAFWPSVALPVPILYALMLVSHVPKAKALAFAIMVPAIFFVALAPLLGATAMPTGFRLLGGLLLLLAFGLSVLLAQIWSDPLMRRVLVACIALVAASFLWATLVDIGIREIALRNDKEWLTDARARLTQFELTQVKLCKSPFKKPPTQHTPKKGIMISYQSSDSETYSVWHTQFLASYLKIHHIAVVAPEIDQTLVGCSEYCQAPDKSPFGPYFASFETKSSSAYICN